MQELQPPPAVDLFILQAGKFHPLAIKIIDLAVRLGRKDLLRHRLGHEGEPVSRFPKLFFREFPVRNVARRTGNRLHLAIGAEYRDKKVVVDASALSTGERYIPANGFFRRDHLFDFAVMHGGMPWFVAEFKAVLSDRLFGGLPPRRQQRLVGVGEAVIQVEDVHQVRGTRQDSLIEPSLLFGISGQPH